MSNTGSPVRMDRAIASSTKIAASGTLHGHGIAVRLLAWHHGYVAGSRNGDASRTVRVTPASYSDRVGWWTEIRQSFDPFGLDHANMLREVSSDNVTRLALYLLPPGAV